mgnify:CR=1 FL=1
MQELNYKLKYLKYKKKYYNLKGGEAVKGNYKVKIFCDGGIIGTDGFTLK